MSNFKKPFFVLFILVLVLILFFLNYKTTSSDRLIGVVKKVNENSAIILGRYDIAEKKPLEEISIGINDNTKIIKTSFSIPPSDGMGQNRPFYVDKLPKEVGEVDIQTLIKDEKNVSVGIEILVKRNLFGGIPMAKEIKYTAPKY